MTVTHEIHVAYSYSPKFRSYYAASYIMERGNPGLPAGDTFRFALSNGMGDSANEAMQESIARTLQDNGRADNVIATRYHGRKPHAVVSGYLFP